MSFAPEPLLDAGVLRHSAPRPAVLMPPDPSEEELAFNWTLSERDIDFIMTNHRGSENLALYQHSCHQPQSSTRHCR